MVSRRPGRHFKMILRLVASFSQSISSFRATATHFIPKTINFQRSPTTKTHNPDLQKLNFREPMYCKYKIYVLQIQKYSIKAPIIFCKYIIYVLQIQKLCINAPTYVVNIHIYILQIYTFVCYKYRNMCILQVWCYWCRARRGFFSAKNTPLFF